MKFSKDFIKEVLSKRESVDALISGKIYNISEITFSIDDSHKVEDLYERIQIKRKYRDYPSHQINSTAPIRDRIVEFVGKRFITEDELMAFLTRLEEDRGNSINQKIWFSRNSKYFESFENRGQKVWTLSKYGKRVHELVVKPKSQKQMINESVGLFKFSSCSR